MREETSHRRTTWTGVGAGLYCPAAVAREPRCIDLFARAATGELLHREGNATGWREWRSLGLPVVRIDGSDVPGAMDWPLAACSGAPHRIDLFARSPDGDLLHAARSGGTWSAFEFLGAPAAIRGGAAIPMGLASPPAACSQGPDRIDIFAVGPDGDLLHTSRNGTSWSGFDSMGMAMLRRAGAELPAPLSGPPAVCGCGPTRMGVFIRGPRGDLLLDWWDGTSWSAFTSLGMPEVEDALYPAVNVAAPLTGPPAACSWGPGRMDVFIRGPRGELLHKYWNGTDWSRYEPLGMPIRRGDQPQGIPFTGAVAACTWGENRLDVFGRALDGNLYHAWWDRTWDHD